jgi:anti-repressor protein
MNALQVFTYTDHPVRVIEINGDPFFVGKDVAEVLGYSNPRDALRKHVDEEDKGVANCDTPGGAQELTVINESGLYSLILQSKLPSARAFKHWVTSEVLPSIRKHGAYLTPTTMEKVLADPDFGITLLQELKAERNKVAALQTTVAVQPSRLRR